MQNFLILHWKKIILILIMIQIIPWYYYLFYQREQKEYLLKKESELKLEAISNQYFLSTQKRYKDFLKQFLSNKQNLQYFTESELEHFQKIIPKKFQELKITFTEENPTTNKHSDFFIWNKKIIFQTPYKNLIKIFTFIDKQGWKLSNITIQNLSADSRNPALEVELSFSFIVSKL